MENNTANMINIVKNTLWQVIVAYPLNCLQNIDSDIESLTDIFF